MELVDAPSLEQLVHDAGPLDPRRAAEVGLGVLDALAAAHAQGIVHRDVKPANVLVGPTVKLADFGVAALRDESGLTVPGMVVGSPSYMAPEQAVAGDVGPAADLWALGALLYFSVEGVPPFSAGSALATASAVVHDRPRQPQRLGALTGPVGALLAKDPGSRPDAGAVRSALLPLAAARPAPQGAATETLPAADPDQPTTATVAFPPSEATLARPQLVPSGGRARRRRTRRLALIAAVAALATGAVAAAQIAGSGRSPDPATTHQTTTSAPRAAPAPAPAAHRAAAQGRHRGSTTTTGVTPPGRSPAPPPGQAKP